MILLIDEECKKQDEYICKTKIYKSQLLLGITSDSYDILGIPEISKETLLDDTISLDTIKDTIYSFQGTYNQKYQNYSSICVKSVITGERKPLWKWSKENRLNEITIPSKDITIYNIEIPKIIELDSKQLLELILSKLSLVTEGDFRQESIKRKWIELLGDNPNKWYIIDMETDVSSGTYIRTLSNDIAEKLNCKGIALDINRIQIDGIRQTNLELF